MKTISLWVLLSAITLAMPVWLTKPALAQEPVETDSRLNSDGAGWKLNQAKVVDTGRPRVLCIGDSILGGYQKSVIAGLDGKAYVDTWVQPYHQGHLKGDYLTRMIQEVLAKGPYDVIVFNFGLHGFQPGRIPEGQFVPLTEKLVDVLRTNAPKAKLIWLSTTPITEPDERPEYWKLPARDKPLPLNHESNPIIVEHNCLAAEVMAARQVPVVDLYTLLLPHLEWARGDLFHWKTPAYEAMATEIVTAVESQLKAK